ENGRVYWTASAVTANGNPVSADLLKQINDHMNSSWVRYFRQHRISGHVTQIDISDDAITLTVTVSTPTTTSTHHHYSAPVPKAFTQEAASPPASFCVYDFFATWRFILY